MRWETYPEDIFHWRQPWEYPGTWLGDIYAIEGKMKECKELSDRFKYF